MKVKADSSVVPSLPNPVFVIGVFRSGTSLLYSLLNQHPQIALMYECCVWDFPEMLSNARFRRDWLQRLEFFNQSLSRHRLVFSDSLKALENVRTPDDLFRAFSLSKGAALYGEKAPQYSTRMQLLSRRYSNGAFILIWRNSVDIYQSIVRAGRKDSFFGRRGMLSRVIFYQEEMIRQSAELERRGVRIRHLVYDDLVKDTENVCRGLCGFLGIEFDEKMLDLTKADFSAVFDGEHHQRLRRGVIESRQPSAEVVASSVIAKLNRFQCRWNRLTGGRFQLQKNQAVAREPFFTELLFHKTVGKLLFALDNLKRAIFEFLPLNWLRIYRDGKGWFFSRRAEPPADHSLFKREL